MLISGRPTRLARLACPDHHQTCQPVVFWDENGCVGTLTRNDAELLFIICHRGFHLLEVLELGLACLACCS